MEILKEDRFSGIYYSNINEEELLYNLKYKVSENPDFQKIQIFSNVETQACSHFRPYLGKIKARGPKIVKKSQR